MSAFGKVLIAACNKMGILVDIVGGNSPEAFATFWRADRARTDNSLADAGITPD